MEVMVDYYGGNGGLLWRNKEWSLLTIAWHYKRLNSSKW